MPPDEMEEGSSMKRHRASAASRLRHGRGGNASRPRRNRASAEAETRHGRGVIASRPRRDENKPLQKVPTRTVEPLCLFVHGMQRSPKGAN